MSQRHNHQRRVSRSLLVSFAFATLACSGDGEGVSAGQPADGGAPSTVAGSVCDEVASRSFVRPFPIDEGEYPFRSCAFETGYGRMHFFDEGPRDAKETLLLVHGNPTWSFLYRNIAKAMIARGHRVIAVDHLGMGMSDAPELIDFDYRPRSHSSVLEKFVVAMNLKNVTLVVQDWGGPIGLGVATRRPELFDRLLIMNTWAWSVDAQNPGDNHGLANWGSLAKSLYAQDPLFGCNTMLTVTADAIGKEVDPSGGTDFANVRDAYLRPAMDLTTRKPLTEKRCAAMSTMATSILGDNAYQAEVEGGLAALQGKPYTLLSGLKDQLFGALGCNPRAAVACPGAALCVCDPEYDATNNACAASPLGDPRVCKLDGAVIPQSLNQWTARLGAESLVARIAEPRAGHMVQEFASGQVVIDMLDQLLAVRPK